MLLASVSEEEWQRTVIQIAKAGGWTFYHSMPAQLGVPKRLRERLGALLKALLAGQVGQAIRIARELLDETKEAEKWRTPVTSKGFPDLLLMRGPELVILELKSETGKTTPEQDAWLDRWRKVSSARYVGVCRPRDEAEVRRILAPAA